MTIATICPFGRAGYEQPNFEARGEGADQPFA